MMPRRSRWDNFGVLLLVYHLVTANEYIPPVTLILVILQIAAFLGFIVPLDPLYARNSCVLPSAVWYGEQWHRLWQGALVHASDMHLYYNMISFIWKGRRLESKFGSVYFAYLVAVFTFISNGLLVAASVILEDTLDFHQFHLINQCAVGFSGVIFALKVLSNEYFPYADNYILGFIPVPSRYACWAELILIHLIAPNSSFAGHLAGIFTGLLYVHGPLKLVMDVPFHMLGGLAEGNVGPARSRPRFHGGNQPTGYRDQPDPPYPPPPPHNPYYDYTGGLSEEEQIRRATQESRHHAGYS